MSETKYEDVEEELLTVEDLAPLLRVRPEWLYAAARRGTVPSVKVGRYVRFRKADIEEWISRGGAS